MKTTRLLTVIAVLQALTLVSQWRNADGASQAVAALPDATADHKETMAEMKNTNAKLDAMLRFLESGKLQVEVVSDKK